MATTKEKLYALHDFDAENPDEVSFKAGETIIVVEKDDAYGDGWWQGTNPRGETGLFPFSYTTFDREQAAAVMNASALESDHADLSTREANGKGVKATMDDIDNALARMQAGRDDASERTGDLSLGETDEGADAEDDYEKRAKARAALAVNAARNQEEEDEAERAEQARLKAEAMRTFQEEEEKHRKLLLQKEEERKEAAAKGDLPVEEKAKEAPIPGVDMSDESDSEGSHGPDFDYAAPTHAPLFGNSTTTPTAAYGAGALAAGAVAGGLVASKNKTPSSSSDSAVSPVDQVAGQQARSLSPIESEDAHAKKAGFAVSPAAVPLPLSSATSNFTPTQNGIFQQQQQQDRHVPDDRSLDSSRVQDSPAPGKTSIGTAPTSFNGTDTPKSFANTAQQSPAPSTAGSRLAAGPGGDPHEWTVEQVVEWGRSKGWDEASVVSKFAEHEISGDVLMEMDANILKEIEITAFGKRFQVANAIKDLKKSYATGGAEQSPMQWSAPVDPSSGLLQQQQNRSVSQPIDSPDLRNEHESSNGSGLGAAITGLGVGGGAAAAAIASAGSQRNVSQSTAPGILPSQGESDIGGRPTSGITEPESTTQDSLRNSTNGPPGKSSFSPDNSINYSNFNQQHATSPRKRESAGSSTKSPADRTSFFAGLGGQKVRKPAPRVQSGGTIGSGTHSGDTEPSSNKGTLSRFGLNRLKGTSATTEPSPNQDLRTKISLPTGSPTYDAMGDTARRHRLSQFGPATANIPGFSSSHQKQASMGSSGAGAGDWHAPGPEPTSPIGNAPEGAVMVRIRPVEFEGWMRKKGERYNSWKPRYMALKGADLVLLRDPTAPKIKGYVNMKGYKVIADENTNPGKYGFKILHESEKPHYFSSDDPIVVREWMKALMKATIGRDTSLPVISSYNNATISLKEAQRMNPPPRPPSPTSRARAQRAAARANKDQLTAKDASVLMGLQSPQERQYGFLEQECLSSPSVEIDTIQVLLNDQKIRSSDRHGQQQEPPQASLPNNNLTKETSQQDLSKSSWTVHPLQQEDESTENKEGIRPIQHFNQKREVKPIQIPPRTHLSTKGLPLLEKDESSSSLLQERFMELSETEGQQKEFNLNKQLVPTPPMTSNSSIGPTPPSKPDQNKRLGIIAANWKQAQCNEDSSSISSTFGLADLPPPPPPTHSADHKRRISEMIEIVQEKASSIEAPTPISKDDGRSENLEESQRKTASSVGSYPTLSPSSMVNAGLVTAPLTIRSKGAGGSKQMTNERSIDHRRPHSAYEPVIDRKEKSESSRERKRSESIPTTTKTSPSNQSSLSSYSISVARSSTRTSKSGNTKWWKKGMEKMKHRSPFSYDTATTSNSISEEYECKSEGKGKGLSENVRQGEVEEQIIFSALNVEEFGRLPPNSQHSDRSMEARLKEESKEIALKIKKLFGVSPSASPKKVSLKMDESPELVNASLPPSSLSFAGGEPARRRSRSVGPSIRHDGLMVQDRVQTFQYPKRHASQGTSNEKNDCQNVDFDSTFDSNYSKSMGIESLTRRRKFEEKKRRSTSLIMFPVHSHKNQIEREDFLTLFHGKEDNIGEAESMANELASFTSCNLPSSKSSTMTKMNEKKQQRQRNDSKNLCSPLSPVSNKTSPSSTITSTSSNQGFHLPSWSKWRKEHNRQRESDLNAERLVAEVEEEIRKEEERIENPTFSLKDVEEIESNDDFSQNYQVQIVHGEQQNQHVSWNLRHNSKEYFGKLRTKIKRKHSLVVGEGSKNSLPQEQKHSIPPSLHSSRPSSRDHPLNQIPDLNIGGTHYDQIYDHHDHCQKRNNISARQSSECVEEIESQSENEWNGGVGRGEMKMNTFQKDLSPPLPPLPPSDLPEKDDHHQLYHPTILSPIPDSATFSKANNNDSTQSPPPPSFMNLLSKEGQKRNQVRSKLADQQKQTTRGREEVQSII